MERAPVQVGADRACVVTKLGVLAPLLFLLTACDKDGSNVGWPDVAFLGVVGATVVGVVWVCAWGLGR